MTAPVSPIATQETPTAVLALIRKHLGEAFSRQWADKVCDVVTEALSSAERRIDELVRERDEALPWALFYRDSLTIGEIAARGLKSGIGLASPLHRAMIDMLDHKGKDYDRLVSTLIDRATAAESRLASLIGQAEPVLALYADRESYRDEYGDLPEHDPGAAAREPFPPLPLAPTGRETSGEET